MKSAQRIMYFYSLVRSLTAVRVYLVIFKCLLHCWKISLPAVFWQSRMKSFVCRCVSKRNVHVKPLDVPTELIYMSVDVPSVCQRKEADFKRSYTRAYTEVNKYKWAIPIEQKSPTNGEASSSQQETGAVVEICGLYVRRR